MRITKPRKRILLFSRGVGLGHATRDIAIINTLRRMYTNLDVKCISYGHALDYFKNEGLKTDEFGVVGEGDRHYSDKFIRIGSIIRDFQPNVIVSDEEFLIILIAKMFSLPVIFITNMFPEESTYAFSLLKYADHIVFPDFNDLYRAPVSLSNKVRFVGPVVRYAHKAASQRQHVFKELGIPGDNKLVVVTAGGRQAESTRMLQSAVRAARLLRHSANFIILAGPAARYIRDGKSVANIRILRETYNINRYIASSDLVITRGGHTTLWELLLSGIPSISVPFSKKINVFNERYATAMEDRGSTKVIKDCHLGAARLAREIESIFRSHKMQHQIEALQNRYRRRTGESATARLIGQYLS